MSRRPPLSTRALEQSRTAKSRPEARDVVLPELLAGLAGAPLEYARSFHQFFFDRAELAMADDGLLVLQHVVIGRPSPRLREIQLWGAECDPIETLRLSTDEIADECGLDADVEDTICTMRLLFVGAVHSLPCLGDAELEDRTVARLLLSTTSTLASVAPYVRIGGGVVLAYQPSNELTLLGPTA